MSHALTRAWQQTLRRWGGERAVAQARDGTARTFRELEERAEAWKARHGAGQFRGQAVVFALPNGFEWLEVFLGLVKAGAVPAPLDAAEPAAAQREGARTLRAGALWDGGKLEALARPRRFRDPEICLIKLTSGSTGRARPLVFTAAQMLADARQVTATMGFRRADLNYALIPLGHSYGLGNLTLPLLAQGVPLVCGSAALPQAMADDFARWRPTVFPGVPSMWRALAASDVRLDSLRLAISAGAPLSAEVACDFAARFGRPIHSFYGSSETGGIAYDRAGGAALRGDVGQALRGVSLHSLPGARLRVSSAAVVTHGRRQRARGHGTWLMPDRATVDARGRVTLLGRRGSIVKLAGRRVNVQEVAERLRRVPGVRDVWVGVSAGTEPVLGAAAVAPGATAMALRAALLVDTAAWKIPKKLVVVDSLPVNARGKVDARALRARVFGA